MKYLGEGWQYTVYDLENGRVYKKYNSWLRCSWIIAKDCFPKRLTVLRQLPKHLRNLRQKATDSFSLLERKKLPEAWFGHPERKSGLDYEQDKLTPFHLLFQKRSTEQSKRAIDTCVTFIYALYRQGVVDKFFNIAKNFSLDKDGNVILTDIGELVSDPQKIAELVRERVWAVDYKSRSIENAELRAYFIERMDEVFFPQ